MRPKKEKVVRCVCKKPVELIFTFHISQVILKSKEVNTSAVKKQSGDSTKVKSAPATTLVHKVKLFNHLYRDNLSITQPRFVHFRYIILT